MTTKTEVVATPKAVLFATREQYIAIIQKLGLELTEQSGFIKVKQPGGTLYVAATKTVRRIDLSGFEMNLSEQLTKLPEQGVFGKVKQQMVVGTGPEGDLERFEEILTHLMLVPAPAKVEKKPKAPKASKEEKKGWKAVPPKPAVETEDAKAARIALIKKIASERGLLVSSKSIASAAE